MSFHGICFHEVKGNISVPFGYKVSHFGLFDHISSPFILTTNEILFSSLGKKCRILFLLWVKFQGILNSFLNFYRGWDWHFMRIVSSGDSLHEVSDPVTFMTEMRRMSSVWCLLNLPIAVKCLVFKETCQTIITSLYKTVKGVFY